VGALIVPSLKSDLLRLRLQEESINLQPKDLACVSSENMIKSEHRIASSRFTVKRLAKYET
jgi:hypothetical protein